MGLSGKQKKYIKKSLKTQSLKEISQSLHIPKNEIQDYLKKKWTKEKYSKFETSRLSIEKEDLLSRINNFKFSEWLKANRFFLVFIGLLVFIVYANAIGNEFVSDDIAGILENPNIGNLNHAFSNPISFGKPLVYFTYHLFGRAPEAFRIINILFHLGNCFLIYFLIHFLANRRAALLGAVLAAVHPIMTESITWISGGVYAQYSFFLLLGLTLYLFSYKNNRFYYLVMAAFLLALFSSEKAMVLPFILIALHLAYPKSFRNWRKLIIPLLIGFIWVGLYFKMVPQRLSSLNVNSEQPQIMNPLIQIPVALGFYLQLIFWPKNLSLYQAELNLSITQFLFNLLFFLAYLSLLVYTFFRKKEYFFWLSLFVIGLLPTLTPFGISWVVAERYTYFGIFGIFAGFGLMLDKLYSKGKYRDIITFLLILAVLALSIRTMVRNTDWKNQNTLWIATDKTSPSSYQNHNNLGDMYTRQGNLDKAIDEFQTAIKLKPNYADAHHNLGNAYMHNEELEKALESFQDALKFNPNLWQSHNSIAAIKFSQEDYTQAENHLREAIKISPQSYDLQTGLAITLFRKGEKQESINILEQILKIYPDYQKAREVLNEINSTE